MEERQISDHTVIFAVAYGAADRKYIGYHVVVGEHYPLGNTGRAAGKDEYADPVDIVPAFWRELLHQFIRREEYSGEQPAEFAPERAGVYIFDEDHFRSLFHTGFFQNGARSDDQSDVCLLSGDPVGFGSSSVIQNRR